MIPKASEKMSKEDDMSKTFPIPLRQSQFFQNLLLTVSVLLVLGTAILHLDLVPSVLLGCAVIGFNYFWTKKFVQKLLVDQKLQALDIIFIITKFGVSVIVLFGAINFLELSPNGLLIGVSNVALATIIFTFFRLFST